MEETTRGRTCPFQNMILLSRVVGRRKGPDLAKAAQPVSSSNTGLVAVSAEVLLLRMWDDSSQVTKAQTCQATCNVFGNRHESTHITLYATLIMSAVECKHSKRNSWTTLAAVEMLPCELGDHGSRHSVWYIERLSSHQHHVHASFLDNVAA